MRTEVLASHQRQQPLHRPETGTAGGCVRSLTELINRLGKNHGLDHAAWLRLFQDWYTLAPDSPERAEVRDLAAGRAVAVRDRVYGRQVFLRGLIEYSNCCANDCYYCGIRTSRKGLERYRLSDEQVLSACAEAYALGLRTFVLQGGENTYDDTHMPGLIAQIRAAYPDCAITLSLGEKEEAVYRSFKEAGADRYLLRHETALDRHYRLLHPEELRLEHRLECLRTLKKLGFQTGCGFMVGSPGQEPESLAADFRLIQELRPEMLGIGPFIPHPDTPLGQEKAGLIEDTLFYLSLARLLQPSLLLPSTTALATAALNGHELGLAAGANVIMPNMTPLQERQRYTLYEGKKNIGTEALEGCRTLCAELRSLGYEVSAVRGDWHPETEIQRGRTAESREENP